jgi:hypothetical protein
MLSTFVAFLPGILQRAFFNFANIFAINVNLAIILSSKI